MDVLCRNKYILYGGFLMLTIDKVSVMNIDNAIRGARNPMSSWDKSDSNYDEMGNYIVGENDLSLAKRLCKAGSDHRKFIRQIFVSVDITAPLYWWKEFVTYKVSTVANSTSTMHKIHSKAIELEDFSFDQLTNESLEQMKLFIQYIERIRLKYIETKDKQYWYDIIQMLPSGYNQLRTCTLNYETLRNIYHSRKSHKLEEWHVVCDWIRGLPYASELILDEA
jgi:hypothetical protein